MPVFYAYRNMIAAVPSTFLMVILLFGMISGVRPLKPKYDELIKLELVEAPMPVQMPMPMPTPPKAELKPELKPERAPPQPRQPPMPVQPVQPEPPRTPLLPAQASPAQASPATVPAPALQPPAAPAAPVSPSKQPEPAPAAAVNPNVESEYIGRIRSYLNSIKRYPSGREASQLRPEGTVKIWFVLRRDGTLVDAGIEQSSNAMLLDEAARKTVGRAAFPGFPEQFMAGQETHRFSVDLQFKPAG